MVNDISPNKVSAKNIGYGDLLSKSEPWGELQTFFQSQDSTYTHVCENPNHPKSQTMLQKRSSHNHTTHHSQWSQNHTSTDSITYIHTGGWLGIPPSSDNADSGQVAA